VAPAAGIYAAGVDVEHYDIELGLGADEGWIEGRATIDFTTTVDQATLPLDFSGLEVLDVEVSPGGARAELADGVLRLELPDPAGSSLVASIHYRGVPDDGLILRDNVHGEPSAFADNWPNRARFWFPSVDHPSDKATVRFTVHAPTEWKVVANGREVGEPTPTRPGAMGPEGDRRTWVWEETVPISTYNMVIGAADLEAVPVGLAACGLAPTSPRDDGCVEVTYWVYPEDVDRAAPSFQRAAQMVDYFSETFGPFPYEKLANVQSATRFGGMENASAIFYSEQAIASGRNIERTVSHEIVHQWFGDSVTEADWHHLWLSEGFATYFGAQFFEVADGLETFRRIMEEERIELIQSGDARRAIYSPEERNLFALLDQNNYEKGAWVLHMLRGIMGDEAFFGGIREYYRRHLDSVALTEDFQAVMEEAHGDDLEWFFEQWIYEPGYPVFDVETDFAAAPAGGGSLTVTVRQTQNRSWPAFRVATELLVVQEGQELRFPVLMEGRETVTRVELPGTAAPQRVVLDPDGWVLKGR
jgi:aminopeptidase N